jgi:tetratricopeptide (TPR) repeat protein
MNLILLAVLLQSALVLPSRSAIENPTAVSPIPQKLYKDYEKFWNRFITGTNDDKLAKDLDKFLQKRKAIDPVWILEGYLALYKHDNAAARAKFTEALKINPKNRIAKYYLAELAFAAGEYAQSAAMYAELLSMGANVPELETKRQRAFLLATDSLLSAAARAERENRLPEAEDYYRQALKIAPNEPALHARLAGLLLKQNKSEEAAIERKAVDDLVPHRAAKPSVAEGVNVDNLEDLGRWGNDIDLFHGIRDAELVTREQLALLIVRYFPQVTEFRQVPRIITDVQTSRAAPDIQIVVAVGLMDPLPSHAFEPGSPVTRGDLARTLARLSRSIGLSVNPGSATAPPDLAPTNDLYSDVQLVLGSGLLTLGDAGSFNVGGYVSGRQAVSAVERLLNTFQQVQR